MARQPTHEDDWPCLACGFSNRASNAICGGARGKLGCKANRSGTCAKDEGVSAQASKFPPLPPPRAVGRAMEAARLSSPSRRTAKSRHGAAPSPSRRTAKSHAGGWVCISCNFKNRPINEVCGGKNGTKGCKGPPPPPPPPPPPAFGGAAPPGRGVLPFSSHARVPQQVSNVLNQRKRKREVPGVVAWKCRSCGFKNVETNTVCGGEGGSKGCKGPRVDCEVPGVLGSADRGRHEDAMKTTNRNWICICGYANRKINTVCGGADRSKGCQVSRKACDVAVFGVSEGTEDAQTEPWMCSCGWKNKAINSVCGGRGKTKFGCKAPRRVQAVEGSGEPDDATEDEPDDATEEEGSDEPDDATDDDWVLAGSGCRGLPPPKKRRRRRGGVKRNNGKF